MIEWLAICPSTPYIPRSEDPGLGNDTILKLGLSGHGYELRIEIGYFNILFPLVLILVDHLYNAYLILLVHSHLLLIFDVYVLLINDDY